MTKALLIAMLAIVAVFLFLTINNYIQQQQFQANNQENGFVLANQLNENLNNKKNSGVSNHAPEENAEPKIVLEEVKDRDKILALAGIIGQNEYYQKFIKGKNFDENVFLLTPEKKNALKEGIGFYQGLPEKNLYQLEFNSEENGNFLLIVDLDSGKVLFFTKIQTINLT